MGLGFKIRELRKEKHLTQEQLGHYLNVSKASISGYENETREPDNKTLIKLSDIFDTSTDYLLGITTVRSRNDDPALEPQAAHKREGLTEAENKQIDDFIKFINSQKDDSDEK